MDTPALPPEALEDLLRWLDEYGWKAGFAVKLLYRRHGIELAPLDAEYLCAVERRRRSLE